MSEINESRREFLKIAGYAAPVVLTLSVMPAYAQSGSGVIVPNPTLELSNNDDGPKDKDPKVKEPKDKDPKVKDLKVK